MEQIKPNNIYCGDSFELIKQVETGSVQLILQDPPYNITPCEWEWDIFTKIEDYWKEWIRITKPGGVIVMTGTQPFTSRLISSNYKMFHQELIWEKNICTGFLNANLRHLKTHENIIVFTKSKSIYNPQMTIGMKYSCSRGFGGQSITNDKSILNNGYTTINEGTRYPTSILKINTEREGLHPTQKPVALFEYLIKTYTDVSDCVFDGFAGSGTTAVACKRTNRDYICVEIDKNYVDIAKRRVVSVNKPLFVL